MSDKITNPDTNAVKQPSPWSWYKKLGFRILFVFLLAMCIPFTSSWYNNVFTLDWLHPHYRDIYDIARFQPSFSQFFGGRGDYGDGEPGGGSDNTTAAGKNRHSRAAINKNGAEADSSSLDGNEKHHHHHHGNDSTQINGNIGDGKSHHHHDESDATSVEGNDDKLAAGEQGYHHGHHHEGDSTSNNAVAQLAQGNGGPESHHHHHHDNDSTQTAGNGGQFAGGQGHHHHHHYRDSTNNNTPAQLVSGNGGHDGHHHHHHNAGGDSSQNANLVAIADTGTRHHHRDTAVPGNDTTNSATISAGNRTNKGDNLGLPPKRSFLADYTDWGIAFLIGIVGGLIWTLLDRKSKSYNILYYWIRVVVRYRAGIGIIGFGFTKLFPTQMPYPSLGLLNSNFGDFTAQKIYWLSVGIVPWYQVFGGVVEIVAGTLLFFRKTTTFGAILLAGALGDITYVNYAYDGGVHVYAFYFVFLALFLIADDVPKIYNLLILERYTVPVRYYPDFRKAWLKYSRIGLKVLVFVIFFVILTYTEIINFKYDPYKQPSTAGVKQLRGNYHVTEFKINGKEIPYDPLDSVRWQQATFEKWTTLSFKVNKPVIIDPSNGGGSPMKDIQRTFEITGVAGGERAFHYYADTIDKVLYLEDKNAIALRGGRRNGRGANHAAGNQKQPDNWISDVALQHIGNEKKMIDPHAWSTRRDREFSAKTSGAKRNRMVLKYSTVDGSRVILTGINESRDSIYVVLDRYNKNYTLPASTLSAGKY